MARTRNSPALYELISDKHRPVRVHYTKPQPMPPPHTERAKHEPEVDDVPETPEAMTHVPEPIERERTRGGLFNLRRAEPVAAPAPVHEPEVIHEPEPTPAPVVTPTPAVVPASAPARQPAEPREPLFSADKVLGFITPGRALRLPIGYVFIAIAALIAIVFATFSIGVDTGSSQTKAELGEIATRNSGGPINEPLADPAVTPNGEQIKSTTPRANQRVQVDDPTSSNTPQPQPQTQRSPRVVRDGAGAEVILVDQASDDPRQVDMNYFVLATQPQAEAERIAAYYAKNGVSTARMIPNNRGMCQVITLRGFVGKDLSTPEARDYESNLLRIGREYRRSQPGATTDMSDMFKQKYQGR